MSSMNNETDFHRMHIIGGPGSGKTTLARHIAGITGAPISELDIIGYEHGAGAKRPLDAKLADIRAIVQQPAWITEGIFLWWTDDLLECADVIVWLDPPAWIALWRIVSRHVRTSLTRTNRHRGIRPLIFFLQNALRYYCDDAIAPSAPDDDSAVTRSTTMETLAGFDHKVIRCRRQSEVAALLRRFRRSTNEGAVAR